MNMLTLDALAVRVLSLLRTIARGLVVSKRIMVIFKLTLTILNLSLFTR